MAKNSALIVVDIQHDFCSGGALAVPGGEEIVPLANRLAAQFENVVITQDWHPEGHISFATEHPGKAPFEQITLPYGQQTLWPVHCVMGSQGAALHPDLDIPHAALIIRKGVHRHVDSYSAFLEADRETKTGLDGYLRSRGITELYFCGLALDYCVAWSAEDAAAFGFKSCVIEDACRAIDLNGSKEAAFHRFAEARIARLPAATLL